MHGNVNELYTRELRYKISHMNVVWDHNEFLNQWSTIIFLLYF